MSERDEDGLAGASDALYVYGRRNGTSILLRIPYDDATACEEVKLPMAGLISDVWSDYRTPGVLFTLGSETTYSYDSLKKQFTDTHLPPH